MMSFFVLGLLSLLVVAWVWVTQPLLSHGAVNSVVAVEPARLETHVRMLCQTFFPRDAGHAKNLDRAATYIRQEFAQAGGRVAEQSYEVHGKIYRNVTALFGPDIPERIVV